MTAGPGHRGDDVDDIPLSVRRFVGALFVLFLVPGIIGFEVWPLTGWRLFSRFRGAELSPDTDQSAWGIAAVDDDGASHMVDLERLPLAYRHASWPMFTLPDAATERRDRVCEALADAVVDIDPGIVTLQITLDNARLVERGGHWVVEHDRTAFHECPAPARGRGAAR